MAEPPGAHRRRRLGRRLQPAGAGRRRCSRGELGGAIVLVFADRRLPGARVGAPSEGIADRARGARRRRGPRRLGPGRAARLGARAPTRRPGRLHARRRAARVLGALPRADPQRRIPSLLPAFPGAHAIGGRARRGRGRHRRARSTSSTRRSTAGRSSLQEAVPSCRRGRRGRAASAHPGRRAPAPAARRRAGCWPAPLTVVDGRVTHRPRRWRTRACPCRGGRCSRSPTRPAWSSSPPAWSAERFELVSTGGTARALREAGLQVTDVAAVTGLAGDARRAGQDAPSVASTGAILADLPPGRPPGAAERGRDRPVRARRREPLPLRRRRRATRASRSTSSSRRSTSAGRRMVRAAAKNHASVGIVTDPGEYAGRAGGAPRARPACREATRRRLAVAAFRLDRRLRRRSSPRELARCAMAACRHRRSRRTARRRGRPGRTAAAGAHRLSWIGPSTCATARTRTRPPRCTGCPGADPAPGRSRAASMPRAGQGAELQQPARRRGGRRPGARPARRGAASIVKHANPCGAAEAADAHRGLGGRPRRRPGQRLRRRGRADAAGRRARWRSGSPRIFLEVVVAPAFDDGGAQPSWPAKTEPAAARGPASWAARRSPAASCAARAAPSS